MHHAHVIDNLLHGFLQLFSLLFFRHGALRILLLLPYLNEPIAESVEEVRFEEVRVVFTNEFDEDGDDVHEG